MIETRRTAARLDEASARRIAAGRIALIEQRIAAARHGPLPSKPNARVARMTAWLKEGCGDWLLDVYQEGRKTFYLMALPGEPKGWIDLAVYQYKARSDALEEIALLARISAHATARLLEHRHDVDLERILHEELVDCDWTWFVDEARQTGMVLETPHGEFRFTREGDGRLIAVTWVLRKS